MVWKITLIPLCLVATGTATLEGGASSSASTALIPGLAAAAGGGVLAHDALQGQQVEVSDDAIMEEAQPADTGDLESPVAYLVVPGKVPKEFVILISAGCR